MKKVPSFSSISFSAKSRELLSPSLARAHQLTLIIRGEAGGTIHRQRKFQLAQPFPRISALPAVTNKATNVPDL